MIQPSRHSRVKARVKNSGESAFLQKIQRIDFLLNRVQLFQQKLPVLPEQLELFPKSAGGPEPEEPVYLQ